jgi:hypothetical protein
MNAVLLGVSCLEAGIQNGDYREEADSMSSVNQKSCVTLEPHLSEKKINTKKKQSSNTLNPQTIQTFCMPHYTEKTGGLSHHQTPAPNLLGRHRPTGEQISSMWYSHSYPWDKPA